jgi:glycerol kinase
MDTWLAWKLSGGDAHVTDTSNASRTLLMDLKTGAWDDELCAALRVPRAILPEIRDNDAVFGATRGVGFLPDGIPITSLIGDQQAALFGHGCHAPGEAKCTYGTGAFLVANTGQEVVRSRAGLLSTAAWKLRGKPVFALEGSTFIAGAIVQWLRDGLGLIRASSDVERLAASVEDSGGVSLVPALVGLGAPHWDPQARGLICGITRGTTAAHVARAALEGIALQVLDLVEALEKDVGRKLRALKVDGGAAENDLLLQFQADVLDRAVLRPAMISSTAAGTAMLAGLSAGIIEKADVKGGRPRGEIRDSSRGWARGSARKGSRRGGGRWRGRGGEVGGGAGVGGGGRGGPVNSGAPHAVDTLEEERDRERQEDRAPEGRRETDEVRVAGPEELSLDRVRPREELVEHPGAERPERQDEVHGSQQA